MAPRPARRRSSNAPSFADVKAAIDKKEAEKKLKKTSSGASAPKPLTPAQRYEQEKSTRQAKGGKGYGGGYSAHLMGGNVRSSSYDRHSRRIVQEETDLYDIIFSYLLDEGYAETSEAAEAIMVNMSEDWRDNIIDEAYVDYRKGKLSTGKSPQQRMSSKLDRIKATATRERGEASSTDSLMTPETKRSQKMGAVKRQMDAHTGVGGAINKALTPGLGNRAGASPRVAYGEPNTDRHQTARYKRGEPSTKG